MYTYGMLFTTARVNRGAENGKQLGRKRIDWWSCVRLGVRPTINSRWSYLILWPVPVTTPSTGQISSSCLSCEEVTQLTILLGAGHGESGGKHVRARVAIERRAALWRTTSWLEAISSIHVISELTLTELGSFSTAFSTSRSTLASEFSTCIWATSCASLCPTALSEHRQPWLCMRGGRGHGGSSPTHCRTTRRA